MLAYSRKSSVPVYINYKENIIIEDEHPILAWKASKDKLRPSWFSEDLQKQFPHGLPKLASMHSEDALTWNLFRTLQLEGKMQCLTDIFMPGIDVHRVWFWGHDANRWSEDIDPQIQDILDQIEPWGKGGTKQQTEPDVILLGRHQVVIVECKLGKPGTKVKAWQRSSKGMRPEYAVFMDKHGFKLFNAFFNYEEHGNRFFQLFRNYVLGAALAIRWDAKFSLLAIVNDSNKNLKGKTHKGEFDCFKSVLTDPSNTYLITWQQIWKALPNETSLLELRKFMLRYPLLCLSQEDTTS